ncbi:HEAT repeat domain-containing protein [Pseudalkalibacillus salsuginis]|uniref:HEAT repeat domain-containing protein n=1 Tax=Pseudalkalibacillus salsuginis TaxID=2910972 RepID=UPI001F1CDE6A|nr:HEAT repeat domain-containing protein [Pseudalkalibacillus salsuginis]MCF6409281.1 HEAT repeat domain-containing protein [Pseudalkalibacillus salsuginis]
MKDLKKSVAEAINLHDWEEIINLLGKEKTNHAGTAPAHVKRKVTDWLLKELKEDTATLRNVTSHFGNSESPSAKEICAHLISECFGNFPEEGARLLHQISDDENWEVREWAAGGCGEVLAKHYDTFYPVINVWKEDESEKVRRATVLAIMYASKSLDESHAPELLRILEPLMQDESDYVKKNLGAFAIGDGLLKRYPNYVITWLKSLVESENVNIRWNIAMVFSAAAARPFHEKGERLLAMLESDDRKPIQRAVDKARRNLEKAVKEPAK